MNRESCSSASLRTRWRPSPPKSTGSTTRCTIARSCAWRLSGKSGSPPLHGIIRTIFAPWWPAPRRAARSSASSRSSGTERAPLATIWASIRPGRPEAFRCTCPWSMRAWRRQSRCERRVVVLGRTALGPKAQIGAKPQAMYDYLRHRSSLLNLAVPSILAVLPAPKQAPDRHPFKK